MNSLETVIVMGAVCPSSQAGCEQRTTNLVLKALLDGLPLGAIYSDLGLQSTNTNVIDKLCTEISI